MYWSLQCLISALTQAGGDGLLFRLLVPSRCGEGGCCFPRLLCSGSRLLYMERALRCVWFQFLGIPQKRGLGCTCVLCLPRPSGSGSQELDRRTLPGCGVPSPLRVPSPSPRPRRSGACALCLGTTLPADVDHPEPQEVFGYKLEACLQCRRCRLWSRVCPFPLPPASCLRRGWAGP